MLPTNPFGPHNPFPGVMKVSTPEEEIEVEVVDKVLNWRFEELARAGFNARQALQLAGDRSVDLHTAVELIKKCGDEYLAFQILS